MQGLTIWGNKWTSSSQRQYFQGTLETRQKRWSHPEKVVEYSFLQLKFILYPCEQFSQAQEDYDYPQMLPDPSLFQAASSLRWREAGRRWHWPPPSWSAQPATPGQVFTQSCAEHLHLFGYAAVTIEIIHGEGKLELFRSWLELFGFGLFLALSDRLEPGKQSQKASKIHLSKISAIHANKQAQVWYCTRSSPLVFSKVQNAWTILSPRGLTASSGILKKSSLLKWPFPCLSRRRNLTTHIHNKLAF